MASAEAYFGLRDWLEQDQRVEPAQFFNRMRQTYSLVHLLYFDGMIVDSRIVAHSLYHTPLATLNKLTNNLRDTLLLAPLRHADLAVQPFDWRDIAPKTLAGQNLAKLARLLRLNSVAACYPMLSHNGRAAFLIIQADMEEREWTHLRRVHDRDIAALAVSFHAKMLASKRPDAYPRHAPDRLTRREIETLSWVAAGKSYWEIAVILGITERTVRFFMSNARRKLNVMTNPQAVAEALWRNLIANPHEASELI
jgi:LuxR family quorum-sensing system transcriptional regulator SinR